MKLAEALLLRSEGQDKLNILKQRIIMNLKAQENEVPGEDPNILLREAAALSDELCSLIKKINKKNNETALDDGMTIADALAERDMLLRRRQLLSEVASNAGGVNLRLTRSEIKIYTTVDVGAIQKEIDSTSQQFRLLDARIQEKNWTVELE